MPKGTKGFRSLMEGLQEGKAHIDGMKKAPTRRVYTLDELLNGVSDGLIVFTDEDRAWLDAPPRGRELI